MARKAPPTLQPHSDDNSHHEDPDAAFMRIFYPSSTEVSVPASTKTPPFSCSLLTSLLTKGHLTPSHFSHLACSFFTDRNAIPTLLELKRHAQSLCLLLSKLQASNLDIEPSPASTVPAFRVPAFDFLNDVYTPYSNTSPAHHLPLPSLVNTLPLLTPEDICPSKAPSCAILKTAEETGDMNTLMAHVNENLELLDHYFSSKGGLLALLPSDDKNGDESERGIFGQWLHYIKALVGRVAELEREVALTREFLGSEHMIPSVWGQRTAGGNKARELVFPQDRYVLAGLSDALWAKLNEDLDITAEMNTAKDRRADEQLRPRGWTGEDLRGAGDGLDEVSWVEVTSRILRVKGQETVFIIPAWDIHPGAEAVRKVENQPLVQTVARGTSQRARVTAKERSDQRRETDALKKEIDDLKFRLQYEKDQMQEWFAIWDVERKERLSAVELAHEELEAEREKWENMQRILKASGLEQTLLSEDSPGKSFNGGRSINWAAGQGV